MPSFLSKMFEKPDLSRSQSNESFHSVTSNSLGKFVSLTRPRLNFVTWSLCTSWPSWWWQWLLVWDSKIFLSKHYWFTSLQVKWTLYSSSWKINLCQFLSWPSAIGLEPGKLQLDPFCHSWQMTMIDRYGLSSLMLLLVLPMLRHCGVTDKVICILGFGSKISALCILAFSTTTSMVFIGNAHLCTFHWSCK